MLSVAAGQLRVIWVPLTGVAVRLLGAVGTVVSAERLYEAVIVADVFPMIW